MPNRILKFKIILYIACPKSDSSLASHYIALEHHHYNDFALVLVDVHEEPELAMRPK